MGWAERTKEGQHHKRNRVPLLQRKGAICVISGDRSTYPQFAAHLITAQVTPGSQLYWEMSSGGGIAAARNLLVKKALAGGAGWVWFIDDDHVFGMDIIGRLLKHDVDIVVPNVLQRAEPHRWVAYEHFDVRSDMTDRELIDLWLAHPDPPRVKPGQTGLVELGQGGTGGMLIAAEVLRTMQQVDRVPWFELGKASPEAPGEDGWFVLKARRYGYRMFCDLDTQMGHLNSVAIWPRRDPKTQLFAPKVEFATMQRAVRLSSEVDDTRCGACGTDLYDEAIHG